MNTTLLTAFLVLATVISVYEFISSKYRPSKSVSLAILAGEILVVAIVVYFGVLGMEFVTVTK